jgi:hypothetical protein
MSLVLPLAMACHLTSADEVSRPPTLGRGSGGSEGRDVALLDERTEDTPNGDPVHRDLADLADASPTADVAIDSSSRTDLSRIDGGAGIDEGRWRIDSGVAGEAGKPCDDEPLCD